MVESVASRESLLRTRSTIMAIIEVSGANPNGDPDGEGRPRTRTDGRGWISAVSIKRKIRDLFEDHESLAFQQLVKELGITNPEQYHVFESHLKGYGKVTRVEANDMARELFNTDANSFLQRFIDVRQFGCTALFDKKGRKEGDKVGLTQTGVVTMSNALSICPIMISEATITKKAPLRSELASIDQSDIAPQSIKQVSHGLYVLQCVVNPNIARQTQTTEGDIAAFKLGLKYAFSSSMSANRPAAQISFARIWCASHKNPLGSFNEQEFVRKLTPTRIGNPQEPSNSLDDYNIPVPDFDFEVANIC